MPRKKKQLDGLTPEQRHLAMCELAKRDCHTFVFEFCKTRYRKRILRDTSLGKDPQTLTDMDFIWTNVIERIPRYPYIEKMLDCLLSYNKLALPKSRQILATWVVLAYCLWYARFKKCANIYLQKEKESEAGFGDPIDSLGSRTEFLHKNLPDELKDAEFVTRISPPLLSFPESGSAVMGLAAGPNQSRGKAPSIIVVDEAAFQRFLRDTLATMIPLAETGAQIVLISTVNGKETFYDTVSDGGQLC